MSEQSAREVKQFLQVLVSGNYVKEGLVAPDLTDMQVRASMLGLGEAMRFGVQDVGTDALSRLSAPATPNVSRPGAPQLPSQGF